VDGDHPIAPERSPLPFRVPLIRTRTTDATGVIRIPVLEDNSPIGEVVLEGVPTDLPIGSAVELTLTVEPNYQIRGQAVVPALNREHRVCIDLPRPPTPTRAELEGRYADLVRRADDARAGLPEGARFAKAGLVRQVRERLQVARGMLDDPTGTEPAKIADGLDEVEGLVRQLAAGWKVDPPKAAFDQRDEEAGDLEARLVQQKPAAAQDGYAKRRKAIRDEAGRAYKAQNSAEWADAYRKMDQLCEELEGQLARIRKPDQARGGEGPPPNPMALLLSCRQHLDRLRETARHKKRFDALQAEFAEAERDLDTISPKAPDATPRINDWFFTRYEPLRKKVEGGAAPRGPRPDGGANTKVDETPGAKS
jgi:hypothetical protein